MPHPDQKYIDALRNNDGPLITEIYKKCRPKTISMIIYYGGNEADGENSLHDGFIDMLHLAKDKDSDFKLDCTFCGFLNLICKRNWLKKKKTQGETFMDPEKDVEDTTSAAWKEFLDKEKRLDLMNRKLAMLSEKCQKIIRLFYKEKYSFRKIAGMLDLNELSARVKKCKCMRELIRLIREDPDFNELT